MLSLATSIAGCLFLFSALTKALDPIYFIQNVSELRVVRDSLLIPTSIAFIGFQGFLGMMLVLRESPHIIFPVATTTLISLLTITLRGHLAHNTKDCGCYGGLIELSTPQSIALDSILILILLAAHTSLADYKIQPSPWRYSIAVLTGSSLGGFFFFSYNYYLKHQKLLFNLSPIKSGKPWKQEWLEGGADFSEVKGKLLVVALSADCPSCKTWVKVLNAMHQRPGLPKVMAIVAIRGESQEKEYVNTALQAHFPAIKQSRRSITKLARSPLPMAILLEDGIIRGKWNQKIPDFLVEPLRKGAAQKGEESKKAVSIIPQPDLTSTPDTLHL